uniref:LRRCT domain-containing protein n=1 Tax=Gouania willdenowi TaxID=441366 RepID=A0A8C5E7C0_GOUWI
MFSCLLAMKPRCYLLILSLACFSNVVLCCPAICKCYPQRAEVVCNEVPLTEYPSQGLPETTTMLTIQFTNITLLTEQHLNATPSLTELHLYSNQLQNVSSHLLRGVPHLHTLDLTGNKLNELPAGVFSHAQLRNLVLKKNQIQKAEADWLPDNSNLTWLDVSGNRLTEVPASLLQKLSQLENLDLSNNKLEKIAANSLTILTRLERLNLQNNKLDTLDPSVFQSMPNLAYLFLTRNKLNKLPPNLFQMLSRLQYLSLEDNQLSHIPTGLLDPLVNLDEDGLDLTVNPFVCDEKMEYLWRWLLKNKKKVFLAGSITCAKPPSLAGRSVLSLTQSELNLHS